MPEARAPLPDEWLREAYFVLLRRMRAAAWLEFGIGLFLTLAVDVLGVLHLPPALLRSALAVHVFMVATGVSFVVLLRRHAPHASGAVDSRHRALCQVFSALFLVQCGAIHVMAYGTFRSMDQYVATTLIYAALLNHPGRFDLYAYGANTAFAIGSLLTARRAWRLPADAGRERHCVLLVPPDAGAAAPRVRGQPRPDGGARRGRGGQPGEERVRGRDEPRAALAAQRHPRLRSADAARRGP